MAHVTDLGFTMEELRLACANGDVRMQVHPDFNALGIFNYTEDVQFRNKWNKITLACRGLILDTVSGEVIARPWEKFFNLGQMDNRIDSNAPVEVTDKMDGSLGILYIRPDGVIAIATRGSFVSEQAIHANGRLHRLHRDVTRYVPVINDYTFLVEIIYADNRIVCNYGDMDDLVLLGAVHKSQGYYLGPLEAQGLLGWTGPVTEVWKYEHFVDAISFPDRKGKEGIVIRSGRNMVKLKQADYVELHRIVTNLSPKTIWEMMGAGKTVADICAGIPDEFHKYVEDIGRELIDQASDIAFEASSEYLDILLDMGCNYVVTPPRKEFAEKAVKSKHKALLFLMLDKKDVAPVVWASIRPRGDVKTLVKDDDDE